MPKKGKSIQDYFEGDDTARVMGRHSNIPECCIKFYIEKWWPRMMTPWSDKYRASFRKENDRLNREYVPCPSCLKNKKVNRLAICNGKTRKGLKKCSLHPHNMMNWIRDMSDSLFYKLSEPILTKRL